MGLPRCGGKFHRAQVRRGEALRAGVAWGKTGDTWCPIDRRGNKVPALTCQNADPNPASAPRRMRYRPVEYSPWRTLNNEAVAQVRRSIQSALAPLALIGPAQRSISLATNPVRYCGVLRSGAGMVTPRLLKRSRTAGVSTASLDALARRCTIASGVPLGNENEPQCRNRGPASPSSCAVGDARAGARSRPGGDRLDGAALDLRQRGRDLLGRCSRCGRRSDPASPARRRGRARA